MNIDALAIYGESMSQKNIALRIMKSPWSQAIVGGTLTLIPGRNYPAWLRHTITWGSTASVTVLVANPRLGFKALGHDPEQEMSQTEPVTLKARAGSAVATGAAMYGVLRFGWWLDEASEKALKKLGVSFPRVVMGVAVGALYYFTDDRKQREDT